MTENWTISLIVKEGRCEAQSTRHRVNASQVVRLVQHTTCPVHLIGAQSRKYGKKSGAGFEFLLFFPADQLDNLAAREGSDDGTGERNGPLTCHMESLKPG
jgi:hypothetical protein